MTKSQKTPATGFTAAEREYIRGELNRFFSTYPSVAKGFQLKICAVARRREVRKSHRPVKGFLNVGSCGLTQAAVCRGCSLPTLGWASFGP